MRKFLVFAVPSVALAVAATLVVAGLPDYARHVAYEQNAMTWIQSVLMVVSGCVAMALAVRLWLAGRKPALWGLVAAGYLTAALDEWFIVHERLRDGLLSGLPPALPWSAPGDVLPLVYAVTGAVVALAVLRSLRADPTAARAFVTGLAILMAAIAADTVDPSLLSREALLQWQTVEEVVELFALSLMLLGLVLYALGRPAPSRKERWAQ